MSVLYSIIYTASYRYSGPVRDQHNALRVRPTQDERQRVEAFDLTLEPPTRIHAHSDYFGTDVLQFAIAEPHEGLTIRAESRVRVEQPPEPPAPPPDAWQPLGTPGYLDAGAEFLGPLAPPADGARVAELAAAARRETPAETLVGVCELIADRFEYRPGATYVGSTVNDLLEGGAGVCQDFVHLGLTMLRSCGIAARYVSGYLFDANGGDGTSAEVDTHAWLEALLPGEDGEVLWVAADPTNRKLAGDDHVKIGHGRDYSDVPPIRGVYRGPTDSKVEASVRMTKLAGG